jgi:macrolide-specific efflux system membrane fusion protein
LAERSNALVVPVQALSGKAGKRSVLVVSNDGVLEERNIETGMETAARVEVVRGLTEGEMVVVGNKTQLRAGERVEPKVTPAS